MRVDFSLQLFIRKQSLYAQMRKSNNSRGNVALQKRTNPRGSNFPSHEIQNSLILPFSKWKGGTNYIHRCICIYHKLELFKISFKVSN